MDLADLLDICERYNKLGWAVIEQLKSVAEDEDRAGECNVNALALIRREFIRPALDILHYDNDGLRDELLALDRAMGPNRADAEDDDEEDGDFEDDRNGAAHLHDDTCPHCGSDAYCATGCPDCGHSPK